MDDVRSAITRAKTIQSINSQNQGKIHTCEGYSFYIDNPSLKVQTVVETIFKDCDIL
ncbi:MAG: hypothetical protein LKE40_04870 [Spirochaetia bacterium]|nr:hypothetical protein [Spirochaetia bacterium]